MPHCRPIETYGTALGLMNTMPLYWVGPKVMSQVSIVFCWDCETLFLDRPNNSSKSPPPSFSKTLFLKKVQHLAFKFFFPAFSSFWTIHEFTSQSLVRLESWENLETSLFPTWKSFPSKKLRSSTRMPSGQQLISFQTILDDDHVKLIVVIKWSIVF